MIYIKRRHLLQFTASTLATWSLSCSNISKQQRRLHRNLSPETGNSRKLALLVGINTYPPKSGISPLQGCLTDVELQRHLLTYRFGFNPKDILTLTDAQATRSGILEAFETHLIQQAQPGDIVVFHYSGHGSQVTDPQPIHSDGLNSTLVPVDSERPAAPNKGAMVQDIMGKTLFLLMAALKTENVTVVLDCCYSGGAKRGNLGIRAVRGGSQFQISPEETAYQQQCLLQLNWTPTEFQHRRGQGVAKGVVITSTNRKQLAADYPFDGFSAGAFTYLMSQYLWQQPGNKPLINALPKIARSTTQISFTLQTPEYEVKPGSSNEQQPVYFLKEPTSSAEAVITKIEGNLVELWLGGINSQSLAAFNQGAILAVVDTKGQSPVRVKLESRQGLIGRGRLLDAQQSQVIQPGSLCTEQVRGIPPNLSLRIGLDPSLGKDIHQAKAALGNLKRLEALPLQQTEVDYIFGRLTDNYRQQLSQGSRNTFQLPNTSSFGLFSPSLEVIPDSFGAAGETVTAAIQRLQAKFKSLLAARIVKLMLNTDSSQLAVTASLSLANQGNQLVAQVFPTRGKTVPTQTTLSPNLAKLPLGAPVQLQIVNSESSALYISILVIDPNGEMTILFPNQWTAPEATAQLGVGETLLIPDPNKDNFSLQTQEPKGITEVLILVSKTPLRQALKALQTIAKRRNQLNGPVTLSTPIEVIDNLLNDLRVRDGLGKNQRSDRAVVEIALVDTNQLAAMSMAFEVI